MKASADNRLFATIRLLLSFNKIVD